MDANPRYTLPYSLGSEACSQSCGSAPSSPRTSRKLTAGRGPLVLPARPVALLSLSNSPAESGFAIAEVPGAVGERVLRGHKEVVEPVLVGLVDGEHLVVVVEAELLRPELHGGLVRDEDLVLLRDLEARAALVFRLALLVVPARAQPLDAARGELVLALRDRDERLRVLPQVLVLRRRLELGLALADEGVPAQVLRLFRHDALLLALLRQRVLDRGLDVRLAEPVGVLRPLRLEEVDLGLVLVLLLRLEPRLLVEVDAAERAVLCYKQGGGWFISK